MRPWGFVFATQNPPGALRLDQVARVRTTTGLQVIGPVIDHRRYTVAGSEDHWRVAKDEMLNDGARWTGPMQPLTKGYWDWPGHRYRRELTGGLDRAGQGFRGSAFDQCSGQMPDWPWHVIDAAGINAVEVSSAVQYHCPIRSCGRQTGG